MPFAPHYRVTCRGTLGNPAAPVEAFSYGLSLARSGGDGGTGGTLDLNDGQAQDIAADMFAFHADGGLNLSALAIAREVRIASIGADGNYTREPWIVEGNVPGAANTTNILPQSALCISLETERYGPTGKGRFFVPMPAHGINQDLVLPQAAVDAVTQASITLINALNNEPNVDVLGLGVCVASTKGYNSEVTRIRVGRVVDTMRSRRRSLDEAYTTSVDIEQNDGTS